MVSVKTLVTYPTDARFQAQAGRETSVYEVEVPAKNQNLDRWSESGTPNHWAISNFYNTLCPYLNARDLKD